MTSDSPEKLQSDLLQNTKIIGLNDQPLVLYHGTRKVFDRFVPSKSGAQGPGIYTTDHPAEYGDIRMHLHSRIVNPYYFYPSDDSLEADVNPELIEQVLPPEEAERVIRRIDTEGIEAYGYEVQDALKAKGHDGIVMVYPFGEPVMKGVTGATVVIAFEPDQMLILGSQQLNQGPKF